MVGVKEEFWRGAVSGGKWQVIPCVYDVQQNRKFEGKKEKKRKGPINIGAGASLREIQLELSVMRFQYHGDGQLNKV